MLTGLEPEDYEGMLKASASDIYGIYDQGGNSVTYSQNYDVYSGWGNLQADKIFEMLDDDGYRIYHYNISDNFISTLYSSGTYIDINNSFHYSSKTFWENLLQENKTYKVDIYKLTTTFTLPDLWERNGAYPLFVWGRSGQSASSGLSLGNPLYTNGYTKVTSGSGVSDPKMPDVYGIIHTTSLDVSVETYQYYVYNKDNNLIGKFPPNNQIGANISVFGSEKKTSVPNDQIFTDDYAILLYPNPTKSITNLQIKLNKPAYISYSIYNIYFEKLYEYSNNTINNGSQKFDIQLNDYPKGIYFIQLKVNSEVKYLKFIVEGE
jgi:hypothetical protein